MIMTFGDKNLHFFDILEVNFNIFYFYKEITNWQDL
jgi:hypothetical protein